MYNLEEKKSHCVFGDTKIHCIRYTDGSANESSDQSLS